MTPTDTTKTAPRATYPDQKGKVAIVTGIGQVGDQTMWGNGAAFAMTLGRNGVKVLGCDLKLAAAEHTQRRIQADPECDVTQSEQVKHIVDEAMKMNGRTGILIKNVGMSMPGSASTMSEKTWDAQMDVNLKSVYLMCHEVPGHHGEAGRRSTINMASMAAKAYIGKAQIAYNATKAAVIQLTWATAMHYAPRGIRMNVVVPGLIHTPLVGVLADKYNNGDYEGLVKKRGNTVPMGRMGECV